MFQIPFHALLLLYLCLPSFLSAAPLSTEIKAADSVFSFQKKMALKGHAGAQYNLGIMYERGSNTTKNMSLARSWFNQAAKQQYKPAQNKLIFLNIEKAGFQINHHEWLKSLRYDARYGDGEALFLLAKMYHLGLGVPKDKRKAVKLFKKAFAANIAGAEDELLIVESEISTKMTSSNSNQLMTKTLSKSTVTTHKQKQPATKKIKSERLAQTTARKNNLIKKQQQLEQSALKQQQQALTAMYKKIQHTKTPVEYPVTPPTTPKPNIIGSDINRDICSGRNQFITSCR